MNLKLLDDLNSSTYLIEHSEAVLAKALEIATNFDVDLEIVRAGALLHDVGRNKTQGICHGVEGAQILKEQGFPKDVVRIAEVHVGAGIPRDEAGLLGLPCQDYLPVTLEEKIVAHADNLIHGTREVSLEFVVEKWKKSMGKNHPSIDRLRKLHGELII
ncbi:MAG: tRNA 2'-O-methylase [Methanobacterium sp. PtaU1.Bin097]|nr:MAG: tRNA 2'-O-methylase [Methanobacterium sp. PtaU1.Bin097]